MRLLCRSMFVPLLSIVMVSAGCPAPSPPSDASAMDGSEAETPRTLCRNNNDCSDGLFCNGVERCLPGTQNADMFGCVAAQSPCASTQTCNEILNRCESDCDRNPDVDGDGFRALNCSEGLDCDDNDPNRFPNNPEVCSPPTTRGQVDDHDEDCNPNTHGGMDSDRDGFLNDRCCNITDNGTLLCGTDCDDFTPSANPASVEICDNIDNNCNQQVDENVVRQFFPDRDRDGFGDINSANSPVNGCAPPTASGADGGIESWATNASDCDDTRASVHIGAVEICDGLDNDCNSQTDDLPASRDGGFTDASLRQLFYPDRDGDGYGDATEPNPMDACRAPIVMADGSTLVWVNNNFDCDDQNPRRHPGAQEVLDCLDNDCDGRINSSDEDQDRDGFPNAVLCPMVPNRDCNDSARTIYPGAQEICNLTDDNCDGSVDEDPSVALSCAQLFPSSLNVANWSCGANGCSPVCRQGTTDNNQLPSDGCECSTSSPCREQCNFLDDDQDGIVDNNFEWANSATTTIRSYSTQPSGLESTTLANGRSFVATYIQNEILLQLFDQVSFVPLGQLSVPASPPQQMLVAASPSGNQAIVIYKPFGSTPRVVIVQDDGISLTTVSPDRPIMNLQSSDEISSVVWSRLDEIIVYIHRDSGDQIAWYSSTLAPQESYTLARTGTSNTSSLEIIGDRVFYTTADASLVPRSVLGAAVLDGRSPPTELTLPDSPPFTIGNAAKSHRWLAHWNGLIVVAATRPGLDIPTLWVVHPTSGVIRSVVLPVPAMSKIRYLTKLSNGSLVVAIERAGVSGLTLLRLDNNLNPIPVVSQMVLSGLVGSTVPITFGMIGPSLTLLAADVSTPSLTSVQVICDPVN